MANFDLEKRTTKFSKNLMVFIKSIHCSAIYMQIIQQVIASGTSIGANYMEANGASSRRDFRNKIFICKKEAQETKYWLKVLSGCIPEQEKEIEILLQECHELVLIFQAITSSLDRKSNITG